MFGLSRLELLVVELEALRQFMTVKIKWQSTHVQLFALKDVTIGSAGLTRSGSDNGEKTTSFELLFEKWVELC